VGVDGPADGVLHPQAGIVPAGGAVEALDPGQQLVGGASAVGGDQQVAPPPGGHGGDGPGQQGDVVTGVVGPGIARP
jgi:hypothetical protein